VYLDATVYLVSQKRPNTIEFVASRRLRSLVVSALAESRRTPTLLGRRTALASKNCFIRAGIRNVTIDKPLSVLLFHTTAARARTAGAREIAEGHRTKLVR